jgi:hypothetical protein
MILRVTAVLVVALLLSSSPGAALDTSPSAILADPNQFDGQPVTLRGTVTNLRGRISARGNAYYTFDLDDGKQAIRVFSFGESACKNGQIAAVEGQFLKVKQQGRYRFYNEVDARRVECR